MKIEIRSETGHLICELTGSLANRFLSYILPNTNLTYRSVMYPNNKHCKQLLITTDCKMMLENKECNLLLWEGYKIDIFNK